MVHPKNPIPDKIIFLNPDFQLCSQEFLCFSQKPMVTGGSWSNLHLLEQRSYCPQGCWAEWLGWLVRMNHRVIHQSSNPCPFMVSVLSWGGLERTPSSKRLQMPACFGAQFSLQCYLLGAAEFHHLVPALPRGRTSFQISQRFGEAFHNPDVPIIYVT